jgi:hypothetical protein
MGDPHAEPLDVDQRRKLVAAVDMWAASHPEPDTPTFGFAGSDLLSPKELAVALAEPTRDGERYFHAVRYVLETMSLEEFVRVFEAAAGMETGATSS